MDADWYLIFQMKQGDEDACDAFVRKYYPDILKYCHFHCRDSGMAEDLTQEVFLKFFTSLPRYQHLGKAKHYLYTIARNLCHDLAACRTELPLDSAGELYADPGSRILERLLVENAVRKLPEELRDVIVLRYWQGLKLTQIAAVLHIGLPLVKYRLRRAKELLRKETEYGPE